MSFETVDQDDVWRTCSDKLVALAALLLSLILTLWLWSKASSDAVRAAQERFDFKISETKFAIQQRLLAYEHILRGGVALFAASEEVTRGDWYAYVSKLEINRYYPGIQGIGFSVYVPQEQKTAHVDAVRAEGFSDYSIRPAGERTEYTPIVYLEPFDWRNQRAFGYDMFSEPVRRAAMERARDSGLASVSGKVLLVQETDNAVQYGFLMYLPVYANGGIPSSAAERRAALQGYVYSPFRINDLMEGILGDAALPDIDLEIYDGGSASSDSLMYDSFSGPLEKPAFSTASVVELNGRAWQLRFRSLPAFDVTVDRKESTLILVAGVIISVLFAVALWLLALNRRRANALEGTNRVLQTEIAERKETEAKLARAKDLAEAANRAKSIFLASMSHELRTPLNAIIGFSEALQERFFGDLNERQTRYVDNIHTAGRHLLSLINDILDLSKVEAGKMELEVSEFELPAVLNHALTLIRERAAIHGIALCLEVAPSIGLVKADERKVKQVVLNLLSNAVRFTPDGGRIVLRARAVDGAVEIAVADTGVGITQNDLDAIFDEFTQVGRTDPGKEEGTGLGLALSKKYVELHGGVVTVDSEPGKGSTFTFTLPERS